MVKYLGNTNLNQIASIARNTPYYLRGINISEDCYILDYFGYDNKEKIGLVLIENPKNNLPIMVAVFKGKVI